MWTFGPAPSAPLPLGGSFSLFPTPSTDAPSTSSDPTLPSLLTLDPVSWNGGLEREVRLLPLLRPVSSPGKWGAFPAPLQPVGFPHEGCPSVAPWAIPLCPPPAETPGLWALGSEHLPGCWTPVPGTGVDGSAESPFEPPGPTTPLARREVEAWKGQRLALNRTGSVGGWSREPRPVGSQPAPASSRAPWGVGAGLAL